MAKYKIVIPKKAIRSVYLYMEETVNGELVGKFTDLKIEGGAVIFEVDSRYEWVYKAGKKDGPAFSVCGKCKNDTVVVLVPQVVT